MNCVKCGKSFQDDAVFCPYCGKKCAILPRKKKIKQRGNGQGTAYLSPNGKSWTAHAVVYNPKRQQKKKSGFPSKTAALSYCPIMRAELLNTEPKADPKTLKQIYDEWETWYEPRVKSMSGYSAAFAHFKPLHERIISTISTGELQTCMDDCDKGKRTHQMMKVTAGLLWSYAFDRKYVDRKITENLYTGKGRSRKREALTEKEVDAIRDAIGKYRYAEYIYCLCFLGFRPGEMLELKKSQLHHEEENDIWYLVEGKKTEAGRDRIVTIPPKILPIILDRSYIPGTDLLFPMYVFTRNKDVFERFKPMTDAYLRESIFKPMMASLGLSDGKVPYSARHTYSNKLKKAEGEDIDKAALIGHSDYTFTQTKYQSTDLTELDKITKSF
jgi:integrase/DNA-directed RNA polymerase subunit RPC12/RpoP